MLKPPDVTTVLHMISRLLPDTTTSSSGGKLHWQRLALLTAATSLARRQAIWRGDELSDAATSSLAR